MKQKHTKKTLCVPPEKGVKAANNHQWAHSIQLGWYAMNRERVLHFLHPKPPQGRAVNHTGAKLWLVEWLWLKSTIFWTLAMDAGCCPKKKKKGNDGRRIQTNTTNYSLVKNQHLTPAMNELSAYIILETACGAYCHWNQPTVYMLRPERGLAPALPLSISMLCKPHCSPLLPSCLAAPLSRSLSSRLERMCSAFCSSVHARAWWSMSAVPWHEQQSEWRQSRGGGRREKSWKERLQMKTEKREPKSSCHTTCWNVIY